MRPAYLIILLAACPILADAQDVATKDSPKPPAKNAKSARRINPDEPAANGKLPATVEKRDVVIWSDGTRMAGDLYLPKNRKEGEKLPAVIFCAGTGGTKGGTGGRLGPIFAEKGYVALAFDYRGWGDSESQLMAVGPQPKPDEKGELSIKVKALRWQMNYTDQTEDIRAAISFLSGEPAVDPKRIGLVGSSYGGGLVTYMAGTDPRVKCVAAQVPGLGGANRGRAVEAAYRLHSQQARGEVEPIPLETGKMTGKMEKYTNMRTNAAKSIGFSALEASAKISIPIIFLVAENEELSNNDVVAEAQRQIAARGVPSKYHVIKGITHYGIYREGFNEATELELAWFNEHLKGAAVKSASTEAASKQAVAPATVPAAGADPVGAAKDSPKASAEQAFATLDRDKDGKLSPGEFVALRTKLKFAHQPEAFANFFQSLDADGDGILTLDEYRKIAEHRPHDGGTNAQTAKKMPEAKDPPKPVATTSPSSPTASAAARPGIEQGFAAMDTDKNGRLSAKEFDVLKGSAKYFKEHPEAVGPLFKKLDTNGDGALTLEEYRNIAKPAQTKGGQGKSQQPPSPSESASPAATQSAAPVTQNQADLAFYEKHIRPVLIKNCYECHSAEADKLKAGLALDSRDALLKGGDSGRAVVLGEPDKSLLITSLLHTDPDLRMPPEKKGGKLKDETIQNFKEWVRRGLPMPEGSTITTEAKMEARMDHWAYKPLEEQAPPDVRLAAWPRTETDRYVLAAMEKKGLSPAGDAEPSALLRRVHLDLTGLPPTPEDIRRFQADPSLAAYARIVDELLGSPRFGERWGRHWLDVVRFAESSGKETDFAYAEAWRYRDYVIAAFNADKPYDRFIREQVSGDLLPAADARSRADLLIATGFLSIGPKSHIEKNPAQFEMDLIDEQIDAVSQAFLATTIACARCHDHKYDPVSQRDYYALAGIFRSTDTLFGTFSTVQNNNPGRLHPLPPRSGLPSAVAPLTDAARKKLEASASKNAERLAELAKKGEVATAEYVSRRIRLHHDRASLDAYEPDGAPKQFITGVVEKKKPSDAPLLFRGEIDRPGEVIPRSLPSMSGRADGVKTGSGRKELADWLASPDNPLTARVMVNRIWLHLFGQGLVRTPDNFGLSGMTPSHPELLDHLAARFIREGWSVKKAIRNLVLSRTYALATTHLEKNHEIDPDNVLLWRMSPRRLDAETIRDAMLATSGKLVLTPPTGSLVGSYAIGGYVVGANTKQADQRSPHRSVYLPNVRNLPHESLALFDMPTGSSVTGQRPQTTVPAQSLYLLNSPYVAELAGLAALRLSKERPGDESHRVTLAYERILNRAPSAAEIASALDFVRSHSKGWSALCQSLWCSYEFLHRP